MNIVIAPITIAKVSARVYGKTAEKRDTWWYYAIPSVGLFSLFILFHCLELVLPGCWSIAWFFYLCFACQITAVRIKTREIYGIVGNPSEDFFSAMVLYPSVATQLDETTKYLSDDEEGKRRSKNLAQIELSESLLTQNGITNKTLNLPYDP